MDLPIKEADLASFAGLAIVVPLIVGALKRLFKTWVSGKEPMICLVVTYIIGVTAKLTIKEAFPGVGWLMLLVGLLIVAATAGTVHDKLLNPLLGKKEG